MSINFALFLQHLSKVQLSDGGLGNGSSTLFALGICTIREPVGMLPEERVVLTLSPTLN